MSVPSLLAVLGVCALLAAGCGGENRALIPQRNAEQLTAYIDEVADANAAGQCDRASRAAGDAERELNGLPAATDKKLKRNLREWLTHLQERIAAECKAPQAEETATPDATESATPAPTESATPSPTASPEPTPSATASPAPTTSEGDPSTGGLGAPEEPSGTGGVLPENG
jgi:hypothetical protein